uniref:ARAD1B16566p n=1 Tax=Blastobotrys adeninivorans TaxID=409370 RepID=A0A060TBL2_BLAAD
MSGQSLGDRSGPRTVKEPSQYTSLRRGSPNVPKAYGTKLHRRPAILNSYHPQDNFARTTFPQPSVQFGRTDNGVDETVPLKRKPDFDMLTIRNRKLQQINNHLRDPGYNDSSVVRPRRTIIEADMPTVGTGIKGAGAWDAPVVNFSVSRIQIGDNAHKEPGMELEIYHPNKNPSIPRQWKLNSCDSAKAVFGEKDVEAVRYAPRSGDLFVLLSRTDRASRTLAVNGKRISNLNKVVYTLQDASHSSIENLFQDLKKHDQGIETGMINVDQANSLRTGPGILIKTLGKKPESQTLSPSPTASAKITPQPISEDAFFGSKDPKGTIEPKKSEEPNSDESVIMSETPERLKSLSSTTRRASLSEWSARPPKEKEVVRVTRSQTGTLANTDQGSQANTKPNDDDTPKEVLPEPFEFKFKDSKPVTVTPADFERLEEGEFMNDTMVNFYLKYLHDKLSDTQPEIAQSTFIFNTFFYEKLTQTGGGYESVKKWTSKIDLFQMRHVIVPIHSKMHWYVAIIYNLPSILRIAQKERTEQVEQAEQQEDVQEVQKGASEPATPNEDDKNDDDDDVALIKQPKPTDVQVRILRSGKTEVLQPKSPRKRRIHDVEEQPCIFILDSLRASGASNSIRILKDYIVSEAWDKKQLKIDRDLIAGSSPRTPQQPNYCDCGVYVIHYIERFLRQPKLFAGLMVDRTGQAKKELENGWGIEKLNRKREVLRNTLLRLRKRQLALNESSKQNGTVPATLATKYDSTNSINSVDGVNGEVPSGTTSTSSIPGPDDQSQDDDDDDEDVVVIDYVSHK